jgi:hypothetical protein
VGALFRGARCTHMNRVRFRITLPSLRSADDIRVGGRWQKTPRWAAGEMHLMSRPSHVVDTF